jgi:hypothetical protein
MKIKIENNEITIVLPITVGRPSASGKTLVVATTGGFMKSDVQHNGKPVSVSINVVIPIR